jgi:hypothetical protein
MATATKTQTPQTAVQDAAVQAQELAERFVETSKKAAAEYLTLTEKAAQSVVGLQREVAAKSDVEWVASLIDAQAELTGEVTKVLVSSGRELLK